MHQAAPERQFLVHFCEKTKTDILHKPFALLICAVVYMENAKKKVSLDVMV